MTERRNFKTLGFLLVPHLKRILSRLFLIGRYCERHQGHQDEGDHWTPTYGEFRRRAYHQAGQAILAAALPKTELLDNITLARQTVFSDVDHQIHDENRAIASCEQMFDCLTAMMGGRAAEAFYISSNRSNCDQEHASHVAGDDTLDKNAEKCLEDSLPMKGRDHVLQVDAIVQQEAIGIDRAWNLDSTAKSTVEQAYNRAVGILQKHRAALNRLAHTLIKKGEISDIEVVVVLHMADLFDEAGT